MHVDPAVKVLATTEFPVADGPHVPNGAVTMPVIWTKFFGKGPRVLQLDRAHGGRPGAGARDHADSTRVPLGGRRDLIPSWSPQLQI